MISPINIRQQQDTLILSFSSPARILSRAVLNGSFCHAPHVLNHHVDGKNASFCAQPAPWLGRAGDGVERYCGKHTLLGELIGTAAYKAVAKGLAPSAGK